MELPGSSEADSSEADISESGKRKSLQNHDAVQQEEADDLDLFSFFTDLLPRFVHKTLKNSLAPSAERVGLSRSQLRAVMTIFRHGSVTMSRLGRWINVEKGTMTAIADALEDQGLITRRRDAEDRRKVMLALSPKGKKLAESCYKELSNAFHERFSGLSAAEREKLLNGLRAVHGILEKM